MEKTSVFKMIEKFLREKKIRRRQLVIFVALALVVALATAGALKLTGITRAKELTMINCPVQIHEHTESCYDGENTLICGYADFVVHTHSLDCYYDDVLTCDFPVIKPHVHTEECYLREEYLAYDQTQPAEMAAEGHTHTDDCYTESPILTCELEESGEEDGHVHTDDCYTVEKELICALSETDPMHILTDKYYKVRETLICEKEEIVLHTHTDACFEEAVFDENGRMIALVSQLPADATVPDSWTRRMVPACGLLQIEEHIHGAGCLDTIKVTSEEAEEYINSMSADEAQETPDDSDTLDVWSGTKECNSRKDIGSDDGAKTVREQFTWSVSINFPEDETWTEFTYTDSFRQEMTGWVLQANGEKIWQEGHPIHHYRALSELDSELNSALKARLAQTGLENDLAYTLVYRDQDGNVITAGDAEVACFEIHFLRETDRALYGQSLGFDYTSVIDTEGFVDNADYTIDSDFTLPDFTGIGNFTFRYTSRIANESGTGEISVKQVWLDVKGNPMTDGMPDHVEMILKQYAIKGGICLTKEPAEPEKWCKLTLYINQGEEVPKHDVWVKSLTEKILGKNIVTLWVPRNALVQLRAEYQDPDNAKTDEDVWTETLDLTDVSACELTVSVEEGYDTIYLNVIGKSPAGFTPDGDFVQYGDAITLNGVDDGWSYTWTRLPLDDGNDIQYVYIVETIRTPDGYFTTVEDDGNGGFIVTNRKLMEPGKIFVEVLWIDTEGNPLPTHPASVEVMLQKKVFADGNAEGEWITVENSSITLPDDQGKWTACWTVPEDGEYRVATVKEDGFISVCAYTTYDGEGNKYTNLEGLSENAGYVTVANVHVLAEDGETVVIKIWENEDGTPDPDHPGEITIVIKRAKSAPGDESEPNESKPDESEPTSSAPESSEPTSSAPESSEPDESEPNESKPDESEPVSSAPESSSPESSEPESSKTDSSEPDESKPELSTPDSSKPDSSKPESSKPESSKPDSSTSGGTPSTGDELHLQLYVVVALISGGLLLLIALFTLIRRIARREK